MLGQLIASGKAQEKEDTVNKEKQEKKERWIEAWMDRRVNKVYDTMWSYIQTYSYTVLKTDGQSAAQTALCKSMGWFILHTTLYSLRNNHR